MVSNEIPQFERISKIEDFSTLYSNEKKELISEFISLNKEIFVNIEGIKKIDREGYFEAIKGILDLISEGFFEANEINQLIQGIEFNIEEDAEGVAQWSDYIITLNKKLFQRNNEGNFQYNIRHDIYHELGHSIIDLAEAGEIESIEEIEDCINKIDTKYETIYISECLESKLKNKILIKERLAENFGFFLNSNMNKEKFCTDRIISIADQELIKLLSISRDTTYEEITEKAKNNNELKELIIIFNNTYDTLEKTWPTIKESLRSFNLQSYLEEKEDTHPLDIERHSEEHQNESSSIAKEFAPESLRTEITDKSSNKTNTYTELNSLGYNQSRSESLLGLVADLVKGLANELPQLQ